MTPLLTLIGLSGKMRGVARDLANYYQLLARGKHPIEITVIQDTAGNGLKLQWEGPGINRRDMPATALSHLPEPEE